jgi:CelD/BcsL family acetyltransferase involved in cellulose biosynthesis
MSYRLLQLTSLEQLRDAALLWDDLWWRSQSTRPTARAETVAQWMEHFAPGGEFQAWVVETEGRWVGLLPLVKTVRGRFLSMGTLPSNEWSSGGDFLLDCDVEAEPVADLLVSAMRDAPWSLLWFEGVLAESRPWKALIDAVQRAALPSDCRLRWRTPVIEIQTDWQASQQQWSKKHHCKMLKAAKRLAERGDLRFVMLDRLDPREVEPLLRKAFEVEDLGWKGEAGSSVLRMPGMFEFFLRQAKQLAEWDQLELSFLELNGRSMAFVYGFGAKAVSYWHKIGYDPEYRCSTPGQLLQYHILEHLHARQDRQAVDCMGPLTEALAKWQPASYPVSRLIVAPRRIFGRLALRIYQWKAQKQLQIEQNPELDGGVQQYEDTAIEA